MYAVRVYLVSLYRALIKGEQIINTCEPEPVAYWLKPLARGTGIHPRRRQRRNFLLIFPKFFHMGISSIIPSWKR